MLVALFEPGTKKQTSLPLMYHYKSINTQRIVYLPFFYPENLKKKKNQKKLMESFLLAQENGAFIYGLSPNLLSYIKTKKRFLVDGQKLSLAVLPQIFDSRFPGWRKSLIAVPVNNEFMFNAARILAQEVKWLHLFSADSGTLKKAADLIYTESGLVTSYDYYYPSGADIVLAPPQHKITSDKPQLIWQSWPRSVIDKNFDELIPLYWGESFILATMDKDKLELFQKQSIIQQTRQLSRYFHNYGFSTSEISLASHHSKRPLIASILSK